MTLIKVDLPTAEVFASQIANVGSAPSESTTGGDLVSWLAPLLVGVVLTILTGALREYMRDRLTQGAESREEGRQKEREGREEKRQIEREVREEARSKALDERASEAALNAEARHREAEAAQRLDAIFDLLSVKIPERQRSRSGDPDTSRSVHENLREMLTQTTYLPTEIRTRIDAIRELLVFVDELGEDAIEGLAFHYGSCSWIAQRCCAEAHELLVAFLRHQALPGKSLLMREFEHALSNLKEHREGEYAQEIAESADGRAAWIEQNPDFTE